VQHAPTAAFAHWTRGVVLLRANILPGALRAAERAVALDPEESDTHVLLARVLLQKSQWEHARSAIADAKVRGADEEELLPLRAAIAAGRGMEASASDTWRTFAHDYPANALARTGHAWTLLEAGDVVSAHTEFEQARLLDPTNAWAIEGLIVTNTRLLPVHRRWWSVVWGRAMQHRQQSMIIGGAILASTGVALLALGVAGTLIPTALTIIGAGLPSFDQWRGRQV
jgi:tetratricopeptide (TPR) repeat protein